VRQQALPFARVRIEAAGGKEDLLPHCKSVGAYRICRNRGRWIGVDANTAKISTKAGFKLAARGVIERTTGRGHCLLDYGWSFGRLQVCF